MAPRLRYLVIFFLLLMSSEPFLSSDLAALQKTPSIHGRVVDANTGLPIPNATLLVWDLHAFIKPRLGAGVYLTDESGRYNVSDPYLVLGHTYWIYAYRGDFEKKTIDYVPSVRKEISLLYSDETNITFSLVPAALVELEGTPYLVQSSATEEQPSVIGVLTEHSLESSFMTEYGFSQDAWFLGLDRDLVIVPADSPVVLEAEVLFFAGEGGYAVPDVGRFDLYNGSMPFLLPQGYVASCQIASFSLRGGVEYVEGEFVKVSSRVDEAQSLGFVVFDERRALGGAQQRTINARADLAQAKVDGDYLRVWSTLREVLGTMDLLQRTLDRKEEISKESTIYLSAIMATFSTVLAFFFFEKKRKKLLSSFLIYAIFLVCLYFSYPGAHIVVDKNARLFLASAVASFLAVSAIVFGIPRAWKERSLEGEVSWKSAVSLIFSMGKRQIRRKKVRGFFTIMSVIILILAFTSLTSFGTVYDIVADKLAATAPSDGVMVKRIQNETSPIFLPLGSGDPTVLSKIVDTYNIALRWKNPPSSNPTVRLVNPKTGNSTLIYGILGVTPTAESLYTHLNETVDGRYLNDNRQNEMLVSTNLAKSLGIKAGENVTLEALGTRVSTSFLVTGLINDERYMNLIDMDGGPFGPLRLLGDGSVRRCNSTEVVVMNSKDAEHLQVMIDALHPKEKRRFVVLSDFVFQPSGQRSIDEIVRTLIFVFNFDVFVSLRRVITYYHIGRLTEFKGAAELTIPLVMVGLNVGVVMMNAVYERRREIRILSMVGLNPTHIGLIFVAEAIILGMVGGSLGYLIGLGFYRVMALFGRDLMVREKLEWWWSAIGFALALAASVLSSLRPAALAVSTYTPSKVKRVKRSEEEKKARREQIFKAFQARDLSLPLKVQVNEREFFIGFFLDRLDELRSGFIERIEEIENVPETETVKGEVMKTIRFDYVFRVAGRERKTRNSLTLAKGPWEDYYRVRLVSQPTVPGVPESAIERTIDFVHDAVLYWVKKKKTLMGTH